MYIVLATGEGEAADRCKREEKPTVVREKESSTENKGDLI